jgi:hypothetical protein
MSSLIYNGFEHKIKFQVFILKKIYKLPIEKCEIINIYLAIDLIIINLYPTQIKPMISQYGQPSRFKVKLNIPFPMLNSFIHVKTLIFVINAW